MPSLLKRTLSQLAWGLAVALAGVAQAGMEADFRRIITDTDLRQSQVTIAAKDLTTDEYLVLIDADEPLAPASTIKLLTSVAALDRLGPDFKFPTRLLLVPATEPGQWPSLALVGSGDPGFCDPALLSRLHTQLKAVRADVPEEITPDTVLADWVEDVHALQQPGFAELIVDDRVFDRQFVHPDWPSDQLSYYYCAQVAGLNFHTNVFDIRAIPTRVGYAPRIQVYPFGPFLQTSNRAKTGGRDSFWIERGEPGNSLTFRGTIRNRMHTPTSITMRDPPALLGGLLAHRLGEAGVPIQATRRARSDETIQGQILEDFRTSLAWVLTRVNQDSANLYAESVFKAMGHRLTGQPGSFASGAAAVRRFLSERMGDRVRPASVRQVDGSGLSHRNRLSARVLVELLAYAHDHPELGDALRPTLAQSGVSGTLSNRLKRTKTFTSTFLGKTGYIGRRVDGQWISASCLAGYLVVPDEDPSAAPRVVAISIMVNGFRPALRNRTIKAFQDRLIMAAEDRVVADRAAGR